MLKINKWILLIALICIYFAIAFSCKSNSPRVERLDGQEAAVWTESSILEAFDGKDGDKYGKGSAISGSVIVVSSPEEDAADANAGSLYFYRNNGSTWTFEEKVTASDGGENDSLGESVDIYDNVAIAGAKDHSSFKGAAYIFRYNGAAWIEDKKAIASDGANGDFFGTSVSIYGDYAIVGSKKNDSSKGAAYIFEYSGGSWDNGNKIIAGDGANLDQFGVSVAIYQDFAIVGADNCDPDGVNDAGCAYIFQNSGGWSQQQKLTASSKGIDYAFGRSVAIYGDIAVVGANSEEVFGVPTGAAHVFRYTNSSWSEETKIYGSETVNNNDFGQCLDIHENNIIVGAHARNSGSAYVFSYNGSNWEEEIKLTASSGGTDDHFGHSVGISGNNIISGADIYDSNKGRLYIFEK